MTDKVEVFASDLLDLLDYCLAAADYLYENCNGPEPTPGLVYVRLYAAATRRTTPASCICCGRIFTPRNYRPLTCGFCYDECSRWGCVAPQDDDDWLGA